LLPDCRQFGGNHCPLVAHAKRGSRKLHLGGASRTCSKPDISGGSRITSELPVIRERSKKIVARKKIVSHFEQDKSEERMRAVDTLNPAHETLALREDTAALISRELDIELSMLLNLTFLLHRTDNFSVCTVVFNLLQTRAYPSIRLVYRRERGPF